MRSMLLCSLFPVLFAASRLLHGNVSSRSEVPAVSAERSRRSRWTLVDEGGGVMRTAIMIATLLLTGSAQATDIRMFGPFSATPNSSATTVRMTVGEVANFDPFFYSGTLRLEYWFFPFPFTGAYQNGWRSAVATLGQLNPGYSFFNVDQTAIFALPPNGYWCPSLQVTEFNGASYLADDWVNFTCRYIGPVPNVPPVAVIFPIPNPLVGTEPFDVYVDAYDSYDLDGTIVEYFWLLSDGSSAFGAEQEFTLPAGEYTLTLAVEDNSGDIGTASIPISVPEPALSLSLGALTLAGLSMLRGGA